MYIASFDDIKKGQISDVYFERTRQVLAGLNIDKKIIAEFVIKNFPGDYQWGVFAGLEDCIELLENLNIDVWSIPEGTIFRRNDPVMIIEGNYLEFGVLETAILGMLCQASGVATKAARCRKAAADRTVLSFGARRMHPAIAPMVERNAYIGGCDGVATIKSAELLGLQPSGTIPHALILLIGDTVEATRAFNEIIDKHIPRVALVDTFIDEKFEALRVAEALGKQLYALRLDTPGNRRGDFFSILQEVRWELDLRGFEHVKLFVSGGLDELNILDLNDIVDGYGIGTSVSAAPVLDYSMDIVEIEGKPIAKRGKNSGRKELYRCDRCYNTIIIPFNKKIETVCKCGGNYNGQLQRLLKEGIRTEKYPTSDRIRDFVLQQLQHYQLNS